MMVWSGLEGGGEPRDQIMPVRRADIGYLHRTTDDFIPCACGMPDMAYFAGYRSAEKSSAPCGGQRNVPAGFGCAQEVFYQQVRSLISS